MPSAAQLLKIYNKLLSHFGPQNWWPARTLLEVVVGAVLVQNTNWGNVEKAIAGLRQARLLNWPALSRISASELAPYIRPCGYYNLKAGRLTNLLAMLKAHNPWNSFFEQNLVAARTQLLRVKGIGPETADALLLYVGKKPIFMVDAYTLRIVSRHGWLPANATYHEAQAFFMRRLPLSHEIFGEFHALLLALAKSYCRKSEPRCHLCPLGRRPRAAKNECP